MYYRFIRARTGSSAGKATPGAAAGPNCRGASDNKYYAPQKMALINHCITRACSGKAFFSPFLSLFCLHPARLRLASMALAGRTADTMETMIRAWVYKRKGIKGWWTGWYEGGKRKAKAFPTKSLAEHFRHIKYTQLNSTLMSSQALSTSGGVTWSRSTDVPSKWKV